MGRRSTSSLLAVVALVALAVASASAYGSAPGSDAVLMRDVTALTLRAGAMTTGRRSRPVPQLTCVGGGACGRSREPKLVQCVQVGFDGNSAQWRCEAELDKSVRLGEVTVSCEGYRHPDDEYILRGSCGLEYELEYTGAASDGQHYTYTYESGHRSSGDFFSTLLWFAIVTVIFIGVWRTCVGTPSTGVRYDSTYGGANPGGYGVYPDPMSCPPGTVPPYPTYTAAPATGGWWPGFATGGFLGYLFGRNRNYGYNTYGYNSGYSSGPRFGSTRRSTFSSSSSSSHRSTGVGGTRNR